MIERGQKRMGEMLIDKGLITTEQLTVALEEQKKTKEFLGAILVKRGQIMEKDLLETLSAQLNIPSIDLEYKYIKWDLVKKFGSSLLLEHKCLVLNADDFSITIATSNPIDPWPLQKAEEAARGLKVKLVLVSEGVVEDAMQRFKQYMKGDISKMFE